ncbi:hypothetical protein Tco_1086143, partial [Tanacetum coccineum]
MGDTIAQTRSKNVSKHSNGPLLARVLALETTKTTQANEMDSFKRKVKKLEKKDKKRTYKLKRLYKVGLSARVVSFEDEGLGEEDASKQGRIANAGITLDSTHFDVDTDMFGVHDLDGDEVIVESVNVVKTAKETFNVVATTVSAATITEVDITLAQALAELKSAKPKATTTLTTTTNATINIAASTRPKAKGLVIHEQEQAPTPTPTVSSQQSSQVKVQDKGKGIMVEEPLKMKKKDQISFVQQEAIRLQAKFDEDERLAREKDEANVAL